MSFCPGKVDKSKNLLNSLKYGKIHGKGNCYFFKFQIPYNYENLSFIFQRIPMLYEITNTTIVSHLFSDWDAQNLHSLALAKKLGYHYSHTYTAIEIWEY